MRLIQVDKVQRGHYLHDLLFARYWSETPAAAVLVLGVGSTALWELNALLVINYTHMFHVTK